MNVIVQERRQTRPVVLVSHREAFFLQLLQRRLHIDCVPEHDHVDDESQRSQLVLLSFLVALAQFASFAVEDSPGRAVPSFAAIQLAECPSALGFIIEHVQGMQRLLNTPKLRDGLRQTSGVLADLQRAHNARRGYPAQLQGTCQPKHVIPVGSDAPQGKTMAGDMVEFAIIGSGIDAPETCATNVGQTRAEAVTEQAESSEHHIVVSACVGDDLRRLQFRLLFEHNRQQDEAVT
jgi:hypothetical protein